MHELMIDSECFGHVCPPWFARQFPMVSSMNVNAVAAQSGVWARDDEQRKTNLDPDHI